MPPDRAIAELIAARQILYLSRAQVSASGLDWRDLVATIERAYATLAVGDAAMPKADYLRYPGRGDYDRIIALFGHLGAPFDVSGLKQICSAQGNAAAGFPRAAGLTILNDPATNRPFAVMDATAISAARTAAVSGIALTHLAAPEQRRVAMIGCGELAHAHLAMIAGLFGAARFMLAAYDTDADRLTAFVAAATALGITADAAADVQQAVRGADIVLPMTTATAPHIRRDWLRDDALYCAVSLLDADLAIYRDAKLVVVDDLDTCLSEGRPLQRLRDAGELDTTRIVAIGDWLAAPRPIDRDDSRPVVFNPMGTIVTDLAAALGVFHRAVAAGLGTRLDL